MGVQPRLIRSRAELPFWIGIVAGVQFVVLTTVAMFTYPGGSIADSSTGGYSFWRNFFSELGMTVTGGGQPNPVSSVLFLIALTGAGLGLVVFFVAAPRLFRHSKAAWPLSLLGSLFGVISGLCYVGIAWTPADLLLEPHVQFVLAAFRTFLVVVVFYTLAVLLNQQYPNRFAIVYALFAVLLAAYIWLLTQGPGLDTPQGLLIQATGQKIIGYAAIICTLIQSWGALQLLRGLQCEPEAA